MPYPNEHSARLRSPGAFDRIRRQNRTVTVSGKKKRVGFMFGVKGGKSEIESLRFPKDEWTPEQARSFANRIAREQKRTVNKFEKAVKAGRDLSTEEDNRGVILGSDMAGGFTAGGSVKLDDHGQPRRKYRKDLIRVGEFVKGGDGQRISVDADRLKGWAETANQYLSNGNRIPVTNGHDTTGDPTKARGYVEDVYVEGDTLYGNFELIGDDAIQAAARSHVSIYSPPQFTDGEGHDYEWPIRHVAMTIDPVITRQQDFVPIAASQGAEPTEAAVLHPADQEHDTMSIDLNQLGEKLGIEGLSKENATDEIVKAFEAKDGDGAGGEEEAAELSQAQERITALEAELKDAKKPVELSNTERVLSQRNLDSDLKALVSGGHITPAVRDQLKPIMSTPVMLSVGDGKDSPNYAPIVDALRENDPVKLGEQTKGQTVELSHSPPGGEADANIDAERKAAKEWAEKNLKPAGA